MLVRLHAIELEAAESELDERLEDIERQCPRRGLVVLHRPPADRDLPGVGDPQPDRARAGRGVATAHRRGHRPARRHASGSATRRCAARSGWSPSPAGSSTGAATRRGRRRRSRSRRPAGSYRRSASRPARCAGYERGARERPGASRERRGQPRDGQAAGARTLGAARRRRVTLPCRVRVVDGRTFSGRAARGAAPGAAARAAALRSDGLVELPRVPGHRPGRSSSIPRRHAGQFLARRRGRRGVARATARACRADRLRRLHSRGAQASRARRRSSGWRRGPDAAGASTPSATRGGCGSTSTSRASCRHCGHCWPSAPVTC